MAKTIRAPSGEHQRALSVFRMSSVQKKTPVTLKVFLDAKKSEAFFVVLRALFPGTKIDTFGKMPCRKPPVAYFRYLVLHHIKMCFTKLQTWIMKEGRITVWIRTRLEFMALGLRLKSSLLSSPSFRVHPIFYPIKGTSRINMPHKARIMVFAGA